MNIKIRWKNIFNKLVRMEFWMNNQKVLHLWIFYKKMLFWKVNIKQKKFKEILIFKIC